MQKNKCMTHAITCLEHDEIHLKTEPCPQCERTLDAARRREKKGNDENKVKQAKIAETENIAKLERLAARKLKPRHAADKLQRVAEEEEPLKKNK